MSPLFPLLLASAAALLPTAAPVLPNYRIVDRIAGPAGSGWDYAAVDPEARVLFVAHGEAVTRIDLTTRAVSSIGAIDHGHAVVPISHRTLLVTSGNDSTVRLLDPVSGAEQAKLPVGDDPDAAVRDPATGHAFVMNAHAGSISEVDPVAKRVIRTIAAKPALEFAAFGRGRTLYVNDEEANEIEVIDVAAGKRTGAIALAGCEGPTGLAFDAVHDRLISACANGKAAIVDTGAQKLIGLIDIGGGPDAVILDAKRRVALIPCGRDGVLEVLALDAPGGVRKVASVKTEVGARTGAVDTTTGTVYLPTAAFDPPAKPGDRPRSRPGTFHILILKPA